MSADQNRLRQARALTVASTARVMASVGVS